VGWEVCGYVLSSYPLFKVNSSNNRQVEVPGGQQIYVAPGGNIAFTQAHSIYIPTGSNPGYFYNVTVSSTAAEIITAYNWKATDGTTGIFNFFHI
jgi:hypothetical protein